MIGSRRGTWRLLAAGAALSLTILSAAAQDADHIRAPLGGAWLDGDRHEAQAPLPAGPAHADYAFSRNAQPDAPRDRLRLKTMSYRGM